VPKWSFTKQRDHVYESKYSFNIEITSSGYESIKFRRIVVYYHTRLTTNKKYPDKMWVEFMSSAEIIRNLRVVWSRYFCRSFAEKVLAFTLIKITAVCYCTQKSMSHFIQNEERFFPLWKKNIKLMTFVIFSFYSVQIIACRFLSYLSKRN